MGIENLTAFAITALLFVITPGMDTVFVLNKSIAQGRTSGAYAALGVNTGVLMHTLFAALGLSLIVAQSEYAFMIIKYAGALYILYMGILQLSKKDKPSCAEKNLQNKSIKKNTFVSGFMTNVLNPKVALFFLAFFPQFIVSTELQNPIPFLLLGFIYATIGIIWYLCLSYFAASFSKRISNNPNPNVWMQKISGVVFLLMGIGILIAG